ncbi:MAG TPA: DUF3168 domain-containing protein [Allosphingosinicella sp.]|jgi:hypothetical protein
MSGLGASDALAARAVAALKTVSGIGVYDAPPFQAVAPYAVVELGPETDWGFKQGRGRELRLAVTLWDRGERPMRLRDLLRAAQLKLEAIEGDGEGWQLVSLHFLRERTVPPRAPAPSALTAATVEYRARLLAL